MFLNCSSIVTLPNVSKWNTSDVMGFKSIFYGCSSLSILPDITKWKALNKNEDINKDCINCLKISYKNI